MASLFTNGNDTIDFTTVTSGTYDDGTQYDAGDGADAVTLPGNATIAGAAGYDDENDFLGGAGNDTITGGDLDDEIYGNADNDSLLGGLGQNYLVGGAGNDVLIGGSGTRWNIDGDAAGYNDATGSLTFSLSSTTTVTGGGIGTDTLSQIEFFEGSTFADTFTADGSFDASYGETNIFEGSGGNDTVTGNGDTGVSYMSANAPVTVNLTGGGAGTGGGGNAGTDTFIGGVRSVYGSDFGDSLTGDEQNNRFFGRGGNDTIDGGSGFDFADYQQFLESDVAGLPDNMGPILADFGGGLTNAQVLGGAAIGLDMLSSIESVRGTDFNDLYIAPFDGSFAFTDFAGVGGNDIVIGNGNTRANYFYSLDDVTVDLNSQIATGSNAGDPANVGTDLLHGVRHVALSRFDDSVIGDSLDNEFYDAGGNDTIDGGAGYDFLDYYQFDLFITSGVTITLNAAGNGAITGGGGTDQTTSVEIFRGTEDNDTFNASAFTSTTSDTWVSFQGMEGNDTITGNGNTRVDYKDASDSVTINLETGTAFSTNAGDSAEIGTDTITTGGGVNQVRGSDFADVITGSTTFTGFESFRGRGGNDTIDGGVGGVDRVDYLDSPNSVIVNLTAGTAIDGWGSTDSLSNFERARGSNFNDTLIGDGGGNRLEGRDGDDVLRGAGGNDDLRGDNGYDIGDYSSETTAFTFTLSASSSAYRPLRPARRIH